MPRISVEEYNRRKSLLADLIAEYKSKHPNESLSVNKANELLHARIGAKMNASGVKEVMSKTRPVMRRQEAPRAAQTIAGETVKVNLRDGREVYVVVLD